MGKKVSWLSAVKKVLSPEPKENKDKITKPKGWFWKQKNQELGSAEAEPTRVDPALPSPSQEVKLIDAENEQAKHAYTVALATAAAAEAAVAAAQAAAEIVRLTTASKSHRAEPKEEIAAIKIQTAFRGYTARKALRALKGLERLKALIDGRPVKRQAITTLRCMQTMTRVQAEIFARRRRMSEENQTLQQHLLQKNEKELEKLRATSNGDGWDDSTRSKAQLEAKRQNRQEAASRREKALAYAHSHQQTWRVSERSGKQTFMDPNNPHWGWNWLEKWMASRPWDDQNDSGKELSSEHTSVKSNMRPIQIHNNQSLDDRPSPSPKKQAATTPRRLSVTELSSEHTSVRSNMRPIQIHNNQSLDDRPSPSPRTQAATTPRHVYVTAPRAKAPSSVSAGRVKLASPKNSVSSVDGKDGRSIQSVKSERHRRHSITGSSSIRDDESSASSPAGSSYKAPTRTVKSKNPVPSLLSTKKDGTPEKDSVGTAKKRLSFSGSPSAARRHSGPPKVNTR